MADIVTPQRDTLKRWQSLKQERESWFEHWREISEYLLPRSGRFFLTDTNRGEKKHNSIYDSTGTRALRILSAGMMSSMTSPARPWFRLATTDEGLMKNAAVKIWLHQITQLMQAIFQRSNTYRALHTMYEELGAFGTAANIVIPDFNTVIHHHPLTVGEYCIATNWRGEVDTLYREFRKSVRQVEAEFGYDNVSRSVRNLYDQKRFDAWVPIIHAIEPRTDRDHGKRDAKNMPWKSCYFEAGEHADKYLRESGFRRFPALCPRWGVSGGDIYGNSPGMEALGDVKQLQHEQLRKAEGIDYQTKPPLQAPTSMKHFESDMTPGGMSFVDAPGAQGGVRTLFETSLDLNHLLADIQDVRGRIQSSFYADLFLMLSNMTDTRMTATEVAERHEEKLLMLGPVTERLQTELLSPLIDLTFDRILETGIAPPPPEELQGQDIRVELMSALAQAQRAVGVNSVDRFVGSLGAVANLRPEVLDKLDVDQWADGYAESLGVDPRIVVPTDKVQELRMQRAQAQQEAEAAAMANQQADTAQKLLAAKTGAEQNALTDMANLLGGGT